MFFLHKATVLLFIVHNIQSNYASVLHIPTRPPPYFPPPYVPQGLDQLPAIDSLLKDGKQHNCYRPCDGTNKTCYYHFNVEWYNTMSKACYDCPFNATDCGRKDCVVADGVKRSITAVNRKMPGPAIEVCQNDKIIVDVENDLMASGTTIHWHGMYQRDHPFMDGTPFVTQCPISPGSSFRYEFSASQAGTYFWHSHVGLQRGDGVAGSLVIRTEKKKDAHGKLYDFDESDHVMLITDWTDRLSVDLFTNYYHAGGSNSPSNFLINGAGRFPVTEGNRTAMTKTRTFEVSKGKRYRFRLINAEFLNCPVELSVDGHNITVIATDGSDLVPVTASSLVSYSGERYDFIINANQKVDNYWIRVRGLLGCEGGTNPVRQVAVLHYKDAKAGEPATLNWDGFPRNGLHINAVNQGEEQANSRPVSKLESLQGTDDSLKPVPDYKFYVAYDLYAKNNSHYNKYPYYGYNQVKNGLGSRTPQLNHISMKLPTTPLLIARPLSDESFCNSSTVRKSCAEEYCQCPHVLQVRLNSVVEIIIIDEGAPFDTNHPFHLHGYSFRVVGQRKLDTRTTVEKVQAFEKAGLMTRNLRNPPLKDTVTVPDGGYTIVRFKADNPGYWLFHCHIEFHAEIGMSLVIKVGEHSEMVPMPENFPTCGNFDLSGVRSAGPDIVKRINNEVDLRNFLSI